MSKEETKDTNVKAAPGNTATEAVPAAETAESPVNGEQVAATPKKDADKPSKSTNKPAEEANAPKGIPTGDEKGSETAEAAPPPPEKPATPDWKNLYAVTLADFDNYRKRMVRDREDLVKSAAKDIVKDLLATVDNLARALDGVKDKSDDPFVTGVRLVYDGLIKTLADHGATPLDVVGEPLDTNFHEAIATLPSPTVEEGHVMNEVKRGWLLHGKLLRAAQVVVSSGKQA